MSEKIYALLLRLYPEHFRKAYGDEALQLFRDRAREERGFPSACRLWLDLLVDLAVSLPREYRQLPPTLLAAVGRPSAEGIPSFHLLEDDAPALLSLLYGGALSLLICASVASLIGQGGTTLPRSAMGAAQRPSYAIPPTPAPPPDKPTRNSDDDQATSQSSPSTTSDPGPGNNLKPQDPGTMRSFTPSRAKSGHVQREIAVKRDFDVASLNRGNGSDPASTSLPLEPSDRYVSRGRYVRHNDSDKGDLRAMTHPPMEARLGSDTRQAAVMALVLAKPGKTGPTLKAHPGGDASCSQETPSGLISPCGSIAVTPASRTGRITISGRNVPLTLFAHRIPGMAGTPVIDKTGLTGNYDFTLEFVPGSPSASNTGPDQMESTFLKAMTDQMGLKLVPSKDTE
jgi:hypothetical protein